MNKAAVDSQTPRRAVTVGEGWGVVGKSEGGKGAQKLYHHVGWSWGREHSMESTANDSVTSSFVDT